MNSSDLAQLYRNMGKPVPQEFHGEKEIRAHKYGAKRKDIGGISFGSTAEAQAYQILTLWVASGAISDLRLQPAFTLQEKFKDASGITVKSIRYTADFQFFDVAEKRTRYIDVKGVETAAFKRAIKLMKDKHPGVTIEIWDRSKVKEMSRV